MDRVIGRLRQALEHAQTQAKGAGGAVQSIKQGISTEVM